MFALHRGGKMAIAATVPLRGGEDLSLAYTPGVAEVCTASVQATAVEGAGHWVHVERPSAVAALLDAFLATTPTGRTA
ncbi:malic enzyme [Streptomyces umbrinus]|uniref:Malic enzyme n=1 Tax=Streptomyces umbrinus TaxID=67370 RepID=A0ABU0TB03_9ACTN|nr:hypothetical protein [Streptomyces umbrinus]MDQ1032980.1 malic enzyme [Streptomyces umbrinus]